MKHDIETREDIIRFVNAFYGNMTSDDIVGHIFLEVEQVDFAKHLPKMYDFWEMLLLDGSNYRGAPMQPHFRVNEKTPLTPAHFDRWLEMFKETIDSLFEGPKAEEAKSKAFNIASTWSYKLEYLRKL
ncbi:MAG: hypothetical protein RI995_2105 [Bacteroidota bacterium]